MKRNKKKKESKSIKTQSNLNLKILTIRKDVALNEAFFLYFNFSS